MHEEKLSEVTKPSYRVLIVNRHFGGEQVPTGRMAADVAAELLLHGHEVEVLTAPSSYAADADSATTQCGARIHYTRSLGEHRRLLSWVWFLIQACVRVPFMRWDRCVLLTDPPFLAALSILLRPWGGRLSRVFWWTMDLYPEMLVASGRLTEEGVVNRFLRGINQAIIRRMGGFILLGPCQLERMRTYPAWRDSDYIVVPPWDARPIQRVVREQNRFLEKYDLVQKKVALYAGNLGEGHTFATLVEAARELDRAGRDDWAIVFVIRGSKKPQLLEAAKDLRHIRVLDYQPPDWTSDLLWSAHVHLITMNDQSKGLVVPSKLYGVLQTDAPVLFIGPPDADTALEIERYHAGETLSNGSSGAEVVAALDRLYAAGQAGNSAKLPPDADGPERIANFVTASIR